MELRRIQYFVTVAEELSFCKAAKRLEMSQPPITLQIQILENELGVQLFNRTKRKVELTTEGAVILKEAYLLLENSERFRNIARLSKLGKTKRISVGITAAASPKVLPRIYKAFSQKHPTIGVNFEELKTTEVLNKLKEGGLDFGFVQINKVASPLVFYPLFQDQFIVALPEEHPLSKRKIVSLETLETEPMVILKRQFSSQLYDNTLAACQQAGFYPNIVQENNSMQSHLISIASGIGVALIPKSFQMMCTSNIVYRNLRENHLLTEISLVWNAESKSEYMEQFIGISQKAFPRKE